MLVLALIARFASPEDATQVAHQPARPQPPARRRIRHARLARGRRAIARCQPGRRRTGVESPVAQMVAPSGLPDRSFKRRFTQATGMPPLEYIHTLRLEEAKQMLESSDLPVEAVAFEVGYQDASFFGRLFRRKVTLTPAQYRKRFGALGTQLRRAAQPVE
jgi:transcriptional regulator GlxA family with amidase domain